MGDFPMGGQGTTAGRAACASKRQCGRAFHTVHDEAGLAILHAGVLEQGVHHETRIRGHVGHQQAQLKVHFPGERGAFHHFGPRHHAGPELIHGTPFPAACVFFQPHVHVGRKTQAYCLGPHESHIAVDDLRLFQPPYAAQHSAGRQAHGLGNLLIGGTPVCLQTAQYVSIQLVQCIHPFNYAGFLQERQAERPKTPES